MAPTEVASSTISHLDFNPDTQQCIVRFHSGMRYAYSPMTREKYEEFLAAKSIGRWFTENVRNNGNYKVQPLGQEPKGQQPETEPVSA